MHFLRDVIKFRSNQHAKAGPDENLEGTENEDVEEGDDEDDDQIEFIITEEDLDEDNRDLSDIFVELSDEEQEDQEQQHPETDLQNEINRQQLKETCFNISDDLQLEDFECDELEDDIELTPTMTLKNDLSYESLPSSSTQTADIRHHVIITDCQQQQQTDDRLLETLQNDVGIVDDQNSSDGSKSTRSNLSDNFEIEVDEQFVEEFEQPEIETEPKEEPIEYQQEENRESEREMKEEEHTDGTEKIVVNEPPLKKFKRKKGRLVKKKIQKYSSYGMNEDMIFGELITSMLMKIEDEGHKKKVKKEILSLFF
jgi:hypothetical protein